MITLKDVASEVGLNISSVSLILRRDDPRYSPATRHRVREAARRLGYRPNLVAQSLAHGKTRSIGIVGHDLATALNVERLQAISTFAAEEGYHMFLGGGGVPTHEAVEEMLDRRVDGLLVFLLPDSDLSLFESLPRRGVPVVLLGTPVQPTRLPLLSVDVIEGAYRATRHLLDLGHRDIAYAAGCTIAKIPASRIEGFTRALRESGLRRDERRILSRVVGTRESVEEFVSSQLHQAKRPTAFMFMNDEMAAVGIHVMRKMNLDVPGDVSVVGYDDLPIAQYTWPELTTVRQPRMELGRLAVNFLLDQIRGKTSSSRVVLKPELIVRRSTAPVGADARRNRET